MNDHPAPDIQGFTFERQLGSGGFADVYLATQHLPQRQVAVKVLRQVVRDDAARERFEAEANTTAALSSHPAIVTVHYAALTGSGNPYLVMEHCSRGTLAQRYRQKALSVPELLQTLIRLAGAVETAHRSGILHGDIKPANILTTDYGWPALTDFGLASLMGEADAEADALSVPWAAPEVIVSRARDHRSDVYSLGATAYTLLAGRAPFGGDDGGDTSALVARILSTHPAPIERDDLPEPLARLIDVTLAKEPADRPQSASEFARALQRIEQSMNLPATALDIPAAPVAVIREDTDSEATRMVARSEATRVVARGRAPGAAKAPEAPPMLDAEATLLAPGRQQPSASAPAGGATVAGGAYDPASGVRDARYKPREAPVIDAPSFARAAATPANDPASEPASLMAAQAASARAGATRRHLLHLRYGLLGIVSLAIIVGAVAVIVVALNP